MDWILSIIPSDVITLFAVIILGYITYWVYKNRRLILGLGLTCVMGYVIYLQYSKHDLVRQVESGNLYDEFKRTSRGYSLNNPGNIRNSSTKFAGEVHSSDPGFKEFVDMKHGFRAMATLLHSYVSNGHNSIYDIINRYAPASDGNNPNSYANRVAKNVGIPEHATLGERDFRNGNMMNIMYFMTRVEQGYSPNIKDLADGYDMFMKENQ